MTTTLTPITEGKTKQLFPVDGDPTRALVVSKDDITAGDGAKHDLLNGKAALANRTTCNVFRLLKQCGIPVAFDEQVDAVSFRAPNCKMLPYEVVVRREAHGSYLDRNPHLPKGHYFPRLVLEYFLKTSGKKWMDYDLKKDDPLMRFCEFEIELYYPGHSADERKTASPGILVGQKPFLTLAFGEVCTRVREETEIIPKMGEIAKRVFLILEKAWQLAGRKMVDFKVEFGLDFEGRLLLADVIDNDSWRVVENGAYIDKQFYREGGALDAVLEKYARVASLTDDFRIPDQRIIVWKGSASDSCSGLARAISEGTIQVVKTEHVTCSVHKEPVRSISEITRLAQEFPDSVVVAIIGRSNGAGPTLSAATNLPVITVPASGIEFPEDVWSSLRGPSEVPVMTVFDQSNAGLAALNILSLRNPKIYAFLRTKLEARLINTLSV